MQIEPVLTQANEWGRAIVQAYMGWYVFFVAGNIAVLGWIHTRRMGERTAKKLMAALRAIAWILAFLNAGGILSSFMILWYLNELLQPYHRLLMVVFFAGIANTLALVGLLCAWIWVLLIRTYEAVVARVD